MKRFKQVGSTHIVIIICLVVALIFALGIAFYQNFVANNQVFVENSKSSSKSITAPSGGNEKQVATRQYCFKYEPICFDYDATWSVNATEIKFPENYSQDVQYADKAEVIDEKGDTVLRFRSGISGIGGMCDPNDYSDQYVMPYSVWQTKLTPSFERTDHHADQVYAVQLVAKSSKGYTATTMLTLFKDLTVLSKKSNPCTNYLANIVPGSISLTADKSVKGSFVFSEEGFGDNIVLKEFATENEAIASLKTPTAMKAFELLKSVRY